MLGTKKRKLDKLKNSNFTSLEQKTRIKKKINEDGKEKITRKKSSDESEEEEEISEESDREKTTVKAKATDGGFAVPKKKEKKIIELEEETRSEGSDLQFEFDDEYGWNFFFFWKIILKK